MMLSELNDAEYLDEIGLAVGDDTAWAKFVVEPLLGRTQDALDMLSASLASQVLRYGNTPDADLEWVHRAQGMQRLVAARSKQVRRRLGVGQPGLEQGHGARETLWKAFAHELCELVEDSDLAGELDDVDAPFGNITAQEWVSRRRVKRGLDAEWSGERTADAVVKRTDDRVATTARFAQELAEALELVDYTALQRISIGDISAIEWLAIRRERKAAA